MAFPFQFLLQNVLPHILMAKDKKKHSKKDKASEDILDAMALSLKKFRKVTKQLSKLSTGQKLVGGAALLAAGLAYLAARAPENTAATDGPATPDEAAPEPNKLPPRRSRKHLKPHE